jgi:hypothetical protein
MLDLNEMLNSIITKASDPDIKVLGQFIYNDYIRSALKRINTNPKGIEKTTLFYINLERFKVIFKNFEEIICDLFEIIEKDPDWIIQIRKKQQFLSSTLSIIDLMEFLGNIRLDDRVNAGTKSKIKALLHMIDQNIISKWSCKNVLQQNGVSIYFPEIEKFGHDKIYMLYRNILCSAGKFTPTNWDRLLDKLPLPGTG